MNWRPKDWEKIVTKDWTQNYDEAGRLCFEAGADAMLEKVCEEIKKVRDSGMISIEKVNELYPKGIPRGYHVLREAGIGEGYELFRQKILARFKEVKNGNK